MTQMKFYNCHVKLNGNGKRTIWKYAQADFTKACSLIEATNWESLLTGDVNQALTNWEAKYMEIMELCIPKKPLPKRRNLPWLTKELTKGIRKRNLLYRRARRGGYLIDIKNKGTKL